MMGVVLWSDLNDQKAVFWCEDQGDLAFYDATADGHHLQGQMNAGDMVSFDLTFERKMRRAHNAQIVEQKVCHGLQDQLRESAAQSGTDQVAEKRSGEVVQLHPSPAHAASPRRVRNR